MDKNNRNRDTRIPFLVLFLLLSVVFYRDAFQVIPAIFSSKKIIFNTITSIERNWLWYLRDITIFSWCIFWPVLYLKHRVGKKLFWGTQLLLAALTAVGLIGHMLKPESTLLFLGFRQLLYLHAAAGVLWFAVYKVSDQQVKYVLNLALATVFISATAGILQLIVFDAPIGFRTLGIFSHAGVFGYTMLGCSLLFSSAWLRGLSTKPTFLVGMLFCFLGTLASGTRAPMISVLLVTSFTIFSKIRSLKSTIINRNIRALSYLIFIFSIPLSLILLISITESIANRGSLIGVNTGDNGRLGILFFYLNELNDLGVSGILFGQGLGYGTNAAALLLNKDVRVLDGTINALLSQFGIIGVFIGFLIPMLILSFARNIGSRVERLALAAPILIMCLTINIMEISVFILPASFAIGVMLRSHDKVRIQQKIETVHCCDNSISKG